MGDRFKEQSQRQGKGSASTQEDWLQHEGKVGAQGIEGGRVGRRRRERDREPAREWFVKSKTSDSVIPDLWGAVSYRKFNLANYTEKIKYSLWYVMKLNFYVQVVSKHSKSVAWTVFYLFLQLLSGKH